MIKFSLSYGINESIKNLKSIIGNFIAKNDDEIQMLDRREWIYKLWKNFKYRNWDLRKFEDIYLIPTNRSTIRKLKTFKKIFSIRTSKNLSIKPLASIFEKFGVVFVEDEFDLDEISKWDK